ncbi:hypothetical protein PZA11_007251 [Diplocarpon coronariae]|uniref:BHLH domain-containing protein n=1 Tax=Diplocarpon coronariae TaxID=2795749 RepID=A0A218YUR0_9HELO|nr:hypothetical protein JHW43_001394 [Diplocarpon mali]OWO97992.1 hypothetical protein B2J93_8217 [Marssonina coronariae]
MASTDVRQGSSVDYFPTQKRPQIKITTHGWDSVSHNDSAIASDSCDSTLSSPGSPESLAFFPTGYMLPKTKFNPDIKSEQAFDFGTFEDWMRWDDPGDVALSPTSELFPDFESESTSPATSGLELQGSGYGIRGSTTEDSAVCEEDPTIDAPFFQSLTELTAPRTNDNSSHEGLYSTPSSWPRPVSRSQQQQHDCKLSPEEEYKLRRIAMPPTTPDQYPASTSSTPSSPDPPKRHKRKSSIGGDEDDESPELSNGHQHAPKKTAHNMIEKRYRTNLNDKIAILRDSVPSLRVMSKKNACGDVQEEDLQGLTPAHKLNKATVLSKATEYIAHLEKQNRDLAKENSSLKSRVDAFGILAMSRQPQQQQQNLMSNQQCSHQPSIVGRQQLGLSRQQYVMDRLNTPM